MLSTKCDMRSDSRLIIRSQRLPCSAFLARPINNVSLNMRICASGVRNSWLTADTKSAQCANEFLLFPKLQHRSTRRDNGEHDDNTKKPTF